MCKYKHMCIYMFVCFFIVCCDDGKVYSFGQNKFGELGLGNDREVETPTLIPNLPSVSKITCGRHHSAAIDGMERVTLYKMREMERGGRGRIYRLKEETFLINDPLFLFVFQMTVSYGCGGGAVKDNWEQVN